MKRVQGHVSPVHIMFASQAEVHPFRVALEKGCVYEESLWFGGVCPWVIHTSTARIKQSTGNKQAQVLSHMFWFL